MRWHRRHRRPLLGHGISLLVPVYFAEGSEDRQANWAWLQQYWAYHLPGAEIIEGHDLEAGCRPFSKAVAVNDAASRARGDIFVILDNDAYLYYSAVLECAERIREAREDGKRLWFVPYRRFYRLTGHVTRLILRSDPCGPVWPEDPPEPVQVETVDETSFSSGHWYGALVQIMPREAFESIGGWDERFRSWGQEDHSMLHCVDTVWGRHRTLNGPVYHLHHSKLGTLATTRTWEGGTAGQNNWLGARYVAAIGDPQRMMNVRKQTDT